MIHVERRFKLRTVEFLDHSDDLSRLGILEVLVTLENKDVQMTDHF